MLATRLILAAGICVAGTRDHCGAGETLDGCGRANASAGTKQPRAKAKEQWVALFNGRDLTGWYTFLQKHGKDRDPDHVITIEDDAIHLYKACARGQPGCDGVHRAPRRSMAITTFGFSIAGGPRSFSRGTS